MPMWTTAQRIRENVQDIRRERRLVRELYTASPRAREELFEVLRRAEGDDA